MGFARVLEFGKDRGGFWASLIEATPSALEALSMGINPFGLKPKLFLQASIVVGEDTYTLHIFGSRWSTTPNLGVVSHDKFLPLMRKALKAETRTQEHYITKGERRFELQDPFMALYLPELSLQTLAGSELV